MALTDSGDPFGFLRNGGHASVQNTQNALDSTQQQQQSIQRLAQQMQAPAAGGSVAPSGSLQGYAQQQLSKYGWAPDQFGALQQLFQRESGWNPNAVNPSSGAFGIAQILPSAHPDVPRNLSPYAQIDWGLNYIKGRYGSPNGALAHENSDNWY